MKLYKLTDQNMQTRGKYQWTLGEERTASGNGGLCGPGWLHFYTDPLLAVLLNPIHANISEPRLFEAEGDVGEDDHGLKVGCRRATLVREIQLPVVTKKQHVRFAILCAQLVCSDPSWNSWAEKWLSGKDRSAEAARAAAWAESATWSAAWAAAEAARTLDLDLIAIAKQAMEKDNATTT